MGISNSIQKGMEEGSWIRRMFEEGLKLKAQFGAENVFDFSLGNPDVMPPHEFRRVLLDEAAKEAPLIHCYMPNAGYPDTRKALAAHYAATTGLNVGFENMIMTCGAGGAMNVILKSILEPQDEVIVLAPYFMEYRYYISNHQGKMVVVKTGPGFVPDVDAVARAVTPRTKALIINTPNNPTGVLYTPEVLMGLATMLDVRSKEIGHEIYLLSDEPYRELIYDGLQYHSPLNFYKHTIVVTSNSKDLSLAGERIGHIVIHPETPAARDLFDAMAFSNRILGFVNANALMQRVVARLVGVRVDPQVYQRRRDLLCSNLRRIGFDFVCPQGAFYLFPKCPIEDDKRFVDIMKNNHVIIVPGSGFDAPGYFRISYAVPEQMIINSIPYFEKAAKELGLA